MKYPTLNDWLIAGSIDGKGGQDNIFRTALLESCVPLEHGPVYDEARQEVNCYCFWSPDDDNWLLTYNGLQILTANCTRGEWLVTTCAGAWEGYQDDFEKVG